ncbi:uncharacterized protein [Macrobrachium rosenbergii]|uniref:uncharacterized protein isoform X1 n=1 Tax=Macrobrachium rosenbergii TaxID=79674 RepID=UPI0034D5869B
MLEKKESFDMEEFTEQLKTLFTNGRFKRQVNLRKVMERWYQGFLNKIPLEDLPKMIFLAVNPNRAEGSEKHRPASRPSEFVDGGAMGVGTMVGRGELTLEVKVDSITRSLEKLEQVLQMKSLTPLLREMQLRLLKLSACEKSISTGPSTLESNFSDTDEKLDDEDEEILAFTEIFEMFGHSIPEQIKSLYGMIISQKKIPVRQGTTGYDKKSFFVYAENKIIMKICDDLTPKDVYHMYQVLRESEDVKGDDDAKRILTQRIDLKPLEKVAGLKDAAFYYLILLMMHKKMLNRLYTHKLIFIFEQLKEMARNDRKSNPKLDLILNVLDRYPIASRPPGLCLIFTVNEGRDGAQKDVLRVKELFEKTYKYDVFTKIDPTAEDIKSIVNKLKHARNKFYDSLVVFFMGHGDKTYLTLKDSCIHRRREFIDPFIQIEWFFKKPKLFFIQACSVKKEKTRVSSTSKDLDAKGVPTQTDSAGWRASAGPEWQEKYADYTEISNINTYADTLISYATMWYQYASRGNEGSLYIDTLVDQLKMHGHTESIENVLRRVHYNVNTVCLLHNESGEEILWRQAPYFESSLLKEFRFNSPE